MLFTFHIFSYIYSPGYPSTFCASLFYFFVSEWSFQDIFIDGDPTPLQQAARAIGQLQTIYGVIPKVYAKGKNAEVSCTTLQVLHRIYFLI